jgi:hypothetical protein
MCEKKLLDTFVRVENFLDIVIILFNFMKLGTNTLQVVVQCSFLTVLVCIDSFSVYKQF